MSTARLTAAYDGAPINRARVQIPAWGRWWADVTTQTAIALDEGDRVTITIADVALVGAVVNGGDRQGGGSSFRVVAGAGGWHTAVAATAYRDDAGVAVADIVRDAAAAVGESVGTLPTTRVAEHYARSAAAASRVLHDVAPRAWYVDAAGVTQLGARASSVYTGNGTRVMTAPEARSVEIVTDEIVALMPGVVVDGGAPATDVEIVLDERRLSVRVYAGASSSREFVALRKIFDAVDPLRAYRAAYEYRVVDQDGGVLDLQPVRSSAGMPDLERVPVRLSPGVRADHVLGSLVTVLFLDGDPSRPRAFTGDDDDAPGWLPDDVEVDATDSATLGASATAVGIGATPRLGVARLGDTVQAGPWAGVITSASARVKAGS